MSELQQTLTQLRGALGEAAVLTGEAISPQHHSDWTNNAPARPAALLLPRNTEQVASALRICHAARQSLVPQGGLTGLAAGAEPRAYDIALSLERLEGIEEIDSAA